MALRNIQTLAAVAISPAVPLSIHNMFPASVLVTCGTATYNVEYTLDDIYNLPSAQITWQPLSTMSAKSATADAKIDFPVTAVRLNVTAWTSGNVVMHILQGDNVN